MNAKNNKKKTLNMIFVGQQYPHLHGFLETKNPEDFTSFGVLEHGLGAYKIDEYSNLVDLISICCMLGKYEHLNYLLELEEGKLWLGHFCTEAFLHACEQGHLRIIERLLEFAIVKEQMKSDGRWYKAMRLAVINDHQPVADYCLNKLNLLQDFKKYLKSFVLLAIENGHKEMMSWLINITSFKESSPDVVKMLEYAGRFEKPEIFEYLLELPDVNTRVQQYCSDTLFSVVESGNLPFVKQILQLSELKDIDGNHLKQITKLFGKNSTKEILELFLKFPAIRQWITDNRQLALRQTIESGNQGMLELLLRNFVKREHSGQELAVALLTLQKSPHHFNMVSYLLDFHEVKDAVLRNRSVLLQLVGQCNSKDIQQLLSKHKWIKLDFAFNGNHLLHKAIERSDKAQVTLLMNYPEVIKQLILEDNLALCLAARHGQKDIFRLLCEYPELGKKLASNNNEILREAAASGNNDIVMALLEWPDVRKNICVNDNEILRKALSGNYRYLALNLLGFPEIFHYAQFQAAVTGVSGLLQLYAGQEMLALKRKKQLFEQKHSKSIFYIEPKKTAQYLLIFRYWIMLNTPEANEEIRLLFSIPSLQKIAHHRFEGGEPDNELLRLALKIGNNEAAMILLDSPAVCMAAKQFNYHVADFAGELNLEEVVDNSESARKRLSRSEELRLAEIRKKYADVISISGGEQKIFESFIKHLEKLYAENPATFISGNDIMILPLTYSEFEQLQFASAMEKKQALEAYYKHSIHTCWRYLQKPNPWLHKKAAFVLTMENSKLKYSSFEIYIPMLALLWTAASDTNVGTVDGCTPQKRMELFILDIAMMARAHNWDKYEEKQNKNGRRSIRYFDDLEADRPTCDSGARRIYEALKFYPTSQSKQLTHQVISEEIREFVRDYYQKNPAFTQKAKQINDDVETILFDDSQYVSKILLGFNISEKEQMIFIFWLCNKYGHDIINYFRTIENGFKPNDSGSHICLFYNQIKDILYRQIRADAVQELRENINLAILGTKQVSDPENAMPLEDTDSYLGWMNANASGTRGFSRFNHWYHGDSGKIRARKLLIIANDPDSNYEDIQSAVSEVYAQSSQARHSLRNYLKNCQVFNESVDELESKAEECSCF